MGTVQGKALFEDIFNTALSDTNYAFIMIGMIIALGLVYFFIEQNDTLEWFVNATLVILIMTFCEMIVYEEGFINCCTTTIGIPNSTPSSLSWLHSMHGCIFSSICSL